MTKHIRLPIVMTQSELGTFRLCRQKWSYAYERRLRPKKKAVPLRVGGYVHDGHEAVYRHLLAHEETIRLGDFISTDELMHVGSKRMGTRLAINESDLHFGIDGPALEEMVEESRAARAQAEAALELLVSEFGQEDQRRFRVVQVEEKFSIPLRTDRGHRTALVWIEGKLDLVVEDREDRALSLVEAKTVGGAADTFDLKHDVDPQPKTYTYAMRYLFPGREVGRTIYSCVRKKKPSLPETNQNGMVSVRKIDTLASYYQGALDAQVSEEDFVRGAKNPHLKAEEYRRTREKQDAILHSLSSSRARWVCRHEVVFQPRDVDRWRHEAVGESRVIRMVRNGRVPITRNGAACRQPNLPDCAYRRLCTWPEEEEPAELLALYDVGEHRHPELHDEEVEHDAFAENTNEADAWQSPF